MKKTVIILLAFMLAGAVTAQHSIKSKSNSHSRKAKAKKLSTNVVSTGYYYIKCAADGKYIDVPGWRTEAGKKDTHLQKYALDNGWDRVIHVQRYRDGWCKPTPAHSPYVFDIEGGEDATQNGAKLQLWNWKRQSNQLFKFKKGRNGDYYYIQAKHSGKYLDVVNSSLYKNGGAIQQWDYHGNPDQRWILEPYDGDVHKIHEGTYYIRNAFSQKYWDVAGRGWETNENSRQVQIWQMDDGDDRRVKFIPADGPYFYIQFQNGGRVADIQGADKGNRGNLVIYEKKGGDNQKFRISAVKGDDDRFVIIAKHSNKAIDVSGGNSEIHKNGPDLHQWTIHKGKSQQWKLIHADGPFKGQPFRLSSK